MGTWMPASDIRVSSTSQLTELAPEGSPAHESSGGVRAGASSACRSHESSDMDRGPSSAISAQLLPASGASLTGSGCAVAGSAAAGAAAEGIDSTVAPGAPPSSSIGASSTPTRAIVSDSRVWATRASSTVGALGSSGAATSMSRSGAASSMPRPTSADRAPASSGSSCRTVVEALAWTTDPLRTASGPSHIGCRTTRTCWPVVGAGKTRATSAPCLM